MDTNYEGLNSEEEQGGITLTFEDGSTQECEIIGIFPVNDQDYIALLPIDEEESEGDVLIFRYNEGDGDEPDLSEIDNDEEFDLVSEAFDELLDELDDEDFDEDEDDE